jgi:SAM-dependent methyltransferase
MENTDIDWNLEWKLRMERNEAQKGSGCSSYWDTRESALKFYESSFEDGGERVNWIVGNIPYTPDSKILDVGAGPGTIAISLAGRAAAVTAVEPSPAMAGVLREKIAENGIENITVVEKPWEAVDPGSDLNPPYDIVFASFSLGMHDLWEAIDKMNSVCRGRVLLFHFAGGNSWEPMMRELWPIMHGEEFHPGPKADIIFNLLYSKGIYPDIVSAPHGYRLDYKSIDDAVDEFAKRLNAETGEHYGILRKYFSEKLEQDPETREYYMDMRSRKMCISWDSPGNFENR